ncbi:MAG: 3-phosphoshikimate 1-carboxyvinyltransferase [Bacteroidota bacterium]|jgi:3-phosphoshikimate 1-carboxyvinyltransferase
MDRIKLFPPEQKKLTSVNISLEYSKSESNRLLVIRQFCKQIFEIKNLSESDDTKVMLDVLERDSMRIQRDEKAVYNVGHAGTAMRFLCAYFSITPGTYVLTGSDRMKERPIGNLVNALRFLGSEIEYLEEEGYPTLLIKGKKIPGGSVTVDSGMSSQFISALMLIAPTLEEGLKLSLIGKTVSSSYIVMTASLMHEFGIDAKITGNDIFIPSGGYRLNNNSLYPVESDWSAASYFYAFAALSKGSVLFLKGLKNISHQPDSICAELFKQFGVESEFINDGVKIFSNSKFIPEFFSYDFTNCPDLVQTIAIVCSGLNISARFTGVSTLRIKETDRVIALKNELKKINVELEISDSNTFNIYPHKSDFVRSDIVIQTYNDHRMAMCFAPLCLIHSGITIENPSVVSKSFPNFWNEIQKTGIRLNIV